MVVVDLGDGGAEPVSVPQAKTWCRIDRNDEDGLVGELVKAARETVERETGLVLVRRGFRLVVERVPADRRIAVPRRPLNQVTAVTAIGGDWGPRAFPAASAQTVVGGQHWRLSEEVATASAEGVEIEFSAGFDEGGVPEALRLAMKQIVAAAYELRGAVAAEMQPAIVPKTARALMAGFRERRV